MKVVKNKVAAPFKQAEFDIEFGRGISTSGCLIDYGIEHNIITNFGSFFPKYIAGKCPQNGGKRLPAPCASPATFTPLCP